LLAVIFYSKAFRQYLLDRQFLARTDHSALQWLRSTPELIGQQARWYEILDEFDFQIVHRPGQSHGNADSLSRRPSRQCGKESDGIKRSEIKVVYLKKIVEGTMWTKKEMAEATKGDPELSMFYKWLCNGELPVEKKELSGTSPVRKSLYVQWERYSVEEGVMYRKGGDVEERRGDKQVVLPVQY